MDTLKNIENIGRKTWLAGIGAYGTGWKYAVNKFDETYAKTNEFVNELVSEGEKLEKEIQEKIQAKGAIDSKVIELKAKLGLGEVSDIEKIELLTVKVELLTAKVAKLVESREVKKLPKAKTAVKRTTVKAKPAAKAVVKKVAAKKPTVVKKATVKKAEAKIPEVAKK